MQYRDNKARVWYIFILVRLDKICVIGRTFITYCSSLVEVESYLDTKVEMIFDILVFAHRPHFLNDLNGAWDILRFFV